MKAFHSDEEERMTSDEREKWMKVIHQRSEERKRRKGAREVRMGHPAKRKTPHTLEMVWGGVGLRAEIFIAQLSPGLWFNLSFHCKVWNRLIKIWCYGTTPLSLHCWPGTVRYASLTAALPFYQVFWNRSTLFFFSSLLWHLFYFVAADVITYLLWLTLYSGILEGWTE